MTPLNQKKIVFCNNVNCIVDLGLLENACIWASQKPLVSKKAISMHGNYPSVSIYGKKLHIHRLLMSYILGRFLTSKEYVHHKNENKLDCRINNLQVMNASNHQSMHNKGKVISEKQKEQIRNWNRIHKLKHGKYVIHEQAEQKDVK